MSTFWVGIMAQEKVGGDQKWVHFGCILRASSHVLFVVQLFWVVLAFVACLNGFKGM